MRPVLALLREAWDRASIYLPLMLMGLLALGSYWLVRNAPIFDAPQAQQPARHEPDYFLRGFAVKTFDAAGRLKSEVLGSEARHFPDTDTLEIDKARLRAISPEGRLTTASADRALSNADGSEVQLFGNAIVVRDAARDPAGQQLPRLEFRGEFLHAFLNSERIKSHKPVVLLRDQDQFTADAMDYDNLDRVMDLRGRVKGQLVPRTAQPAR